MKTLLLTTACFLLTMGATGQTMNNRLGLTLGGGSQKYSGDLGNGFTVKNNVWRGSVALNASYYLNKSFDIGISGSIGDFGFCQPHDMANKEVALAHRCPGCLARVGLGNLSSRMYIAGIQVKYKFNNGYLLKQNSRIQSFVYTGASINGIDDRMKMNCVNEGSYLTVNAGAGARFYLTGRMNIGYMMTIGYFTSDKLDNLSGGYNDLYLQNTFSIGIDF